jgi:hypothetical protein
MDQGDEAGRGHCAAAAAGQERLGRGPAVLPQPPTDPAGPEPGAVAAAEQVANRLAGERPEHGRRDQGSEPVGRGGGGAGQQDHAVARDHQADPDRGL